MTKQYFTDKKTGVRMGVHSKKVMKGAFKAGDVGTYSKKSAANRCRAGFKARKGSTTCKSKGAVHLRKDGKPDMRFSSSHK